MQFVAIDFETATPKLSSACSVGIVTVEDGEIIDEFYSLIRPPHNRYDWKTTRVHGIKAGDTRHAPDFATVFPEILDRLKGKKIVAHNEAFDRKVLNESAKYYGLDLEGLDLSVPWDCTVKLCRSAGYPKANLTYCCQLLSIPLEHHHALSDARACALLYLHHIENKR